MPADSNSSAQPHLQHDSSTNYFEHTQSYMKLATSIINTQQNAFNRSSRLHARIWPQPTRLRGPSAFEVAGECEKKFRRKATGEANRKAAEKSTMTKRRSGRRAGGTKTDCAQESKAATVEGNSQLRGHIRTTKVQKHGGRIRE